MKLGEDLQFACLETMTNILKAMEINVSLLQYINQFTLVNGQSSFAGLIVTYTKTDFEVTI